MIHSICDPRFPPAQEMIRESGDNGMPQGEWGALVHVRETLPRGADASVANEAAGAWTAGARMRRDCPVGLGRVSSLLRALMVSPFQRREVTMERSLEVQDPRSIPFTNPHANPKWTASRVE
jgi:hypothetical protein